MSSFKYSYRSGRRSLAATLLGGCALIFAAPGGALAQTADILATQGNVKKASNQAPRLEEVVVTAQRSRQSLTKAPVSVTFISPATTRNLDIRTLHDIAAVTPSVSFSAQDDYAQVFIRGIGTPYALPGLETSVAIYEDGVYQEGSLGNILNLMDPGSVQVLNGPQGTLYGRNASGGVVLLSTADPTNHEEGTVSTEFGRFGHEQVDAMLNQPITPDLKIRVAGRFQNDDGYIHNDYDGKTLAGGQTKQIRGKLEWSPSALPGFDVLVSSEYSYVDEHHDYARQVVQAPLCLACSPPFNAVPATGYYDVNQNSDGNTKIKNLLNTVRISYDTGAFSFKSLTSFRKVVYSEPTGLDQDFTTVNLFGFKSFYKDDTLQENLTVSSKFSGPINFLAGFDFLNDRGTFDSRFGGLAFAPYEVGPFAGTEPQNSSNVRTQSVAGFIEGTYKVTNALSLIAGARYNVDHRVLSTSNNPLAAELFGNSGFEQRVKSYSFTPRGVIQYATSAGDLYVSETKGFKAGGINTPAFSEAPSIGPEKVSSQEIGLKSRWMDGRLQTSFAGFHYTDDGLQVQVADVNAGGEITKNAGSAEGYGIEGSARFAATANLILGLGGDYLHARFSSYQNPSLNCPTSTGLVACSYDISGSPLPHAPSFTGYITAEYDFPIFKGYQGGLAIDAHYTSAFRFTPGAGGPLELDRQTGYELVNINGWLTPDSRRYRVGFYIDNATNRKYSDFSDTAQPYGAYIQVAEPLSFGVKLQYSFQDWTH